MFVLTNDMTGSRLKLTKKQAFDIFGLQERHEHLVCLPSRQEIKTAGKRFSLGVSSTGGRRKKKIGGTCVIRMGGLGDLAILSSSLSKLKMKYPDKPLVLATKQGHVVPMQGLKCLDLVIAISDLDKYRFERVIDLRYAVEPANIGPGKLSWREYTCFDRSDNFDRLCGVNGEQKVFELPIHEVARHSMEVFFASCKRPIIGLNPTCTSIWRAMPPHYVKPVLEGLAEKGTIILFGKTEAWNADLRRLRKKNAINLLDSWDLEHLIAGCSLMDLIITPDTGTLHIGAALKRPTLGLFGNIDPATRTTYYPTVKTIYQAAALPCIPCWDVPGACWEEKPGADCMRAITPEKICETARMML
jgi:ADP-heptose:LPS heptosyltransferase